MTTFTKFRIENGTDKNGQTVEVIVEASCASAALGKHRKRGANGLGKNWKMTRQPDGWIVAVNGAQKTLEGGYHRLKEVDWNRQTGPFKVS